MSTTPWHEQTCLGYVFVSRRVLVLAAAGGVDNWEVCSATTAYCTHDGRGTIKRLELWLGVSGDVCVVSQAVTMAAAGPEPGGVRDLS